VGLPQNRGELLKLGVSVSATTVRTVLRRAGLGPAPRRIGPSWSEFLRAQESWISTSSLWRQPGSARCTSCLPSNWGPEGCISSVYIGLQEYYSDKTWRTKATGSAYVWPGGGSANWATARRTCENTFVAGWRSYIIVYIGNGASAYTTGQNLACQVN
jgi:hypothetical protein